ncbi:hypothetical protein BDR22DRAFT_272788 [Usnea florida]
MELCSGRKLQDAGPSLKGLTAINSARSPLLKLPQEIKDRIYQLVLGGNLLHIWRDSERDVIRSTKGTTKEQRFNHQICCSEISEDDAHHHFEEEDGNNFYVKNVELRHLGCRVSTNTYLNLPHSGHRSSTNWTVAATVKMDLSLLHACRQIYNEARYILYSTNTFSFNTARNLRAFINFLVQRHVDVNEAVRSLRADLTYPKTDTNGWTQAFSAVTQHMTRLKTLYINVDQLPSWSTSSDAREKEKSMRPVFNNLAILGKAAAESTIITLSDRYLAQYPHHTIWSTPRWTMDEKRLWVQEVRLAIQDVQVLGH